MSTTLDVYEYLLSQYAAALGAATDVVLKTTKGYPAWGKPDAYVPCVAFEVGPWQPGENRVGQKLARAARGYRGWLFARDEVELCAFCDALVEWHKDHGALVVGAQRVECSLLKMDRWEPEAMVQQEAHSEVFMLQAVW